MLTTMLYATLMSLSVILGGVTVWILGDSWVRQAIKWKLGRGKTSPLIIQVNRAGQIKLKTEKNPQYVTFGKDKENRPIVTTINGNKHYLATGVPAHICIEGKSTNVNLLTEHKSSYEDKELINLLSDFLAYNRSENELFKMIKTGIPTWQIILLIALIIVGVVIYYVYIGVIPLPIAPAPVSTPAPVPQPGFTPAG